MNPPELARLPSYSAEPRRGFEERVALTRRRQRSDFVVHSKSGIALRLLQVEHSGNLPVYGSGEPIHGIVELSKIPENVATIDIKVRSVGKIRSCIY